MPYNQNMGYGRGLLDTLPFTPGKIFIVVDSGFYPLANASGLQDIFPPDEFGTQRYFRTVEDAYAATVSGRNDLILLTCDSSHSLSAMLTVAKDRVYFMSMDYAMGMRNLQDQRCRITLNVSSGATNVAAVKVTGNGVGFFGIKITNSSTVAQSLTTVLDESSNGLIMDNCSIHSLGSAQLTATGGSSLQLAGDGSFYHNCQIGADTIINSVANQVVNIKTTDSLSAKRAVFRGCLLRTYTSSADHVFVKVPANGDIDRDVTFDRCIFQNFNNNTGTTLTTAVNSQLSASGFLNLNECYFYGVTDVATAAVGNTNVRIASLSPTAGTAGVAVTPTA